MQALKINRKGWWRRNFKAFFYPAIFLVLAITMALSMAVPVGAATTSYYAVSPSPAWSGPSHPTNNINNGWATPQYAYGDSNWAMSNSSGYTVDYTTFNFNIPAEATINGIQVSFSAYCYRTINAILKRDLNVSLSGNNGGSFTTPQTATLHFDSPDPDPYVMGSTTSITWGGSWTGSSFTNTNFRVRLQATGGADQNSWAFVNNLVVRVDYTAPSPDGYISASANMVYSSAQSAASGLVNSGSTIFSVGQIATISPFTKSKTNNLTGEIQMGGYSQFRHRVGKRIDGFWGTITSVQFSLAKTGIVSGTGYVYVRRVDNDAIIGTIGTIDTSSLSGTSTMVTFNTTPITINSPTDIRISFEFYGDPMNSNNYVRMAYTDDASTWGQMFTYTDYYQDWSNDDILFNINYTQTAYEVDRGFVYFDTSAIPDNATITGATLNVYGATDDSDTNFNIVIVNGQPSYPSNPLVSADFSISHYTSAGGSISTSGFTTSGYNLIPLNATGQGWINKTGVTKLGILSSRDLPPTTPTGNERVSFYSGDYAGTDHDPYLTITFTTPTEIITYSFPGQIGSAAIDSVAGTIGVTMPYGTNTTNLVANFTLSSGATAKVNGTTQTSGSTANSFSSPVQYVVTAQDGVTTQNWTVTVTVAPNAAAEITAFGFPGQAVPANINSGAGTIAIKMPYGTNLSNLVATFNLSDGASAKIVNTAQISGTTANNFTSPVIYTITAQDGTHTKNWVVTVTAPSTAAEIAAFSFPGQLGSATINSGAGTIGVTMPYGTNVNNLAASFTLSSGASVKVGGVAQVSGTTVNDFTNPVVYAVTAEDGTLKNWTVTVTVAPQPPTVASVTLTEFGTSSTVHNVSMPAQVNQGDLLIVLFGDIASTVSTPDGWNLMATEINGSVGLGYARLSVYYRIAIGNEDGQTVNFQTSGSQKGSALVYRITSWHGTTVPEISPVTLGATIHPDSAALDPVAWDIENTLWISAAVMYYTNGVSGYPSGYTGTYVTVTNECQVMSASRTGLLASEDPGNFTTITSYGWVAYTIAVRPAGESLPAHTVTFNANNGSGTMASQTASTPTALTSNSFTRTGYTFSGWNTTDNGTGTGYADGATYSFDADVTLYAQWTANPNTSPVLGTIGNKTIDELTELTFTATATDADLPADNFTYSLTGAPAGASINLTTGVFAWTPTEEQGPGVYSFTVVVSDGTDTDSEEINVTVNEINFAPVVSDIGNQSILEGASFATFDLDDYVTDVDNTDAQITWGFTGNFDFHVSIDATTHVVTITAPNADWFGPSESITFTATDPGALSDNDAALFTITAVNDAPSFTKGANQVVLEDADPQTVTGWATAISKGPSNEDSQTLTFLIDSNTNPSLFSAGPSVASNGTLTYTMAPNANGIATIGVKLQDSGGTASGGVNTSGVQMFNITITAVNDLPMADNKTAFVDFQTNKVITLTGSDIETRDLFFAIVTQPEHGSLINIINSPGSWGIPNLDQADVIYSPAGGYFGTDSFTYKVVDENSGDSNVATVNITVNPPPTYTLTVNIVGSGAVTRNSPGPYYYGNVVQLTAVPDPGWIFSGWSVNVNASNQVTILDNTLVTATFAIDTFTVTFQAGSNGSLSGTATFANIPYNTAWATAVTVPTPVPDTQYHFFDWTPIFPGAITESATYTANFVIDTFNINTSRSGGNAGCTVVASPSVVNAGDFCTITMTPYTFWSHFISRVTDNGVDVTDLIVWHKDATTAPPTSYWTLTLNGVNEDHAVVATFTDYCGIRTGTLYAGTGSTAVSGSYDWEPVRWGEYSWTDSYQFRPGEAVTLTATPAEGYHFTWWSGYNDSNPFTFNIDHTYGTFFARFDRTYTITASVDGGHGAISPSGVATVHAVYDPVNYIDYPAQTYSFTPDANYRVHDVLVDGQSVGALTSYTFQSISASAPLTPDNHIIAVSFELATVSIIVASSPAGDGLITVDGNSITTPFTFTWTIGSNHTITAASEMAGAVGTKYVFGNWSDSGAQSHSYTVGASNATVTANFTTQYMVQFRQSGLDSTAETWATVTLPGPVTVDLSGTMSLDSWLSSGDSVTFTFNDQVSSTISGKRFALTSPPGQTSPFIVTGPITFTRSFSPQYRLIMQSNLGITSPVVGEHWYDAGSHVTITATAPSVVDGERYRFIHWAGTGSGSYTGTDNPAVNAVIMNAPINEMATLVHEYYLTVNNGGHGIAGGGDWYDAGASAQATIDETFIFDGTTTAYGFAGWIGNATGSVSPSNNILMDGPKTATATWDTLYWIHFRAVGLSDTAGTFCDTSPGENGGEMDGTVREKNFWMAGGDQVSFTYNTTVTSSVPGKRYSLISGPNVSSPFTVTGSITVTFAYAAQYQLTLAVTESVPGGLSNITGGANGDWYNRDTIINLTAVTPVADGLGKQWRFTNWTGDVASSPNTNNPVSVTMNAARSITANYVTQYQVTFSQSGLDADATGAVVTVDATTKTFAELPFSKWVDAGVTVNYAFVSPVASNVTGKRYVLTAPDPAPPTGFTVSAATTITGAYKTQHQIIFAQSGLSGADADVTAFMGIISSPNQTITLKGAFGDSGYWADNGTNVTYVYQTAVGSTIEGKRFAWDSTTGLGQTARTNTFNVSQSGTIIGTYKTQYYVTFTQIGLGGDANDTVITVDAAAKGYGDLPFSNWVDSGTTINYAFTSPVTSNVSGMQYVLTTPDPSPATGFTVGTAVTVTGTYTTQYQLTLAISPSEKGSISGGTNGTYYDAGIHLDLTATPASGWAFYNWIGDVTLPPNSNNPIAVTMNSPKSITATFRGITSVAFTGQQLVVVPSPLVLSATLTGPSGFIGGQTIKFVSDFNPDGTAGSYVLGTATTSANGQAVTTVNTTGWIPNIVTVQAIFEGTALLTPSQAEDATVTVAPQGSAATGGGWYTLSGSGRINFGFNVNKVPNTTNEYKGQFLLQNNGKWRLKGELNNYGYDAATRTGSASGIGKLYLWDAINLVWDLVDDDVVFSIQFIDNNQGGGSGKKTVTPDQFGININWTPSGSQPDIPNSVPQDLKGGDISMKDLSTPTDEGGSTGNKGGGKK